MTVICVYVRIARDLIGTCRSGALGGWGGGERRSRSRAGCTPRARRPRVRRRARAQGGRAVEPRFPRALPRHCARVRGADHADCAAHLERGDQVDGDGHARRQQRALEGRHPRGYCRIRAAAHGRAGLATCLESYPTRSRAARLPVTHLSEFPPFPPFSPLSPLLHADKFVHLHSAFSPRVTHLISSKASFFGSPRRSGPRRGGGLGRVPSAQPQCVGYYRGVTGVSRQPSSRCPTSRPTSLQWFGGPSQQA